jgi:hypothetical protein
MKTKPQDINHQEAQLRKVTGKNPFQVPDGYFEGFRDRLDSRLNEAAGSAPSVGRPVLSFRWPVAAAAVILLIVAVSVILLRTDRPAEPVEIPEFTITLEDIEETYGMDSFDEFTLVNFYLENQAEDADAINIAKDELISDTTIKESDIEQYLLQSNELENLLLNL